MNLSVPPTFNPTLMHRIPMHSYHAFLIPIPINRESVGIVCVHTKHSRRAKGLATNVNANAPSLNEDATIYVRSLPSVHIKCINAKRTTSLSSATCIHSCMHTNNSQQWHQSFSTIAIPAEGQRLQRHVLQMHHRLFYQC
jgi:hypothetical protein